ncbi:aldehyde dehydrogenase family protein [Talaromyces stipitatus ATCC 10500]|uniref:Aldehyde dehydrogenase family protein n=1 Tax=Talaromyces stipitatus (strain ATCC 10500 / CBS 375.48 / QM 6759 / NRRL 1006) TaxID=441959 RepID=B8MGY9_TALSN|nr:aldehyde dehydrogenase family protein [Talaromyces stipitatus ATCC 10500]EED16370.1 aldehyde dehydrogenase family protein [Talaromyces stipitatus ATCC 10500]
MSHLHQATGTAPHHVPLIIDGREEPGQKAFDVISPYMNKVCWTAASATPPDAVRAVESAQKAFPAWSNTKPTLRRDILLKAADILESRLEENGEFMRTEMGADVPSSTGFIVPLAIRMLRDIASRITSICGSVPIVETEGQSAIVYREPMGVILGIVPWNAPYVFGVRAAASALAGGNTTVIKSSEYTPRCYHVMARAFLDAGLPAGCFNLISTRAEDAAAVVNSMIEHPAVRKVNFTGSTAVGRKVAAFCGQHLKPCLMELGGKNSAIVCEDANIETAAPAVLMGAFLNSGQTCMATDRIILHSAIADNFKSTVKRLLNENSFAPPPTLVSMASKARVTEMITSALSAGAEVVHGVFHNTTSSQPDSDVPKASMAPVILGNVSQDMRIWKEETFASLAAYVVVTSDDEAIGLANEGGYGLSASIFTEDLRKGLAMAKKIQSGAVHINSMTVQDEAALPHGGVKDSGWGRFNSDEGLKEFLVTKTITWMD